MFDTLLIIISFLLASLVCLLTLRLSMNVKHLCLFFSLITDVNEYFDIPIPSVYFDRGLLNLTKISNSVTVKSQKKCKKDLW